MTMRRSIWCNHYQAPAEHTECKAGVKFADLDGPIGKWPCFCKTGESPPGGCDKAQFPTAEEIAYEDAEIERRCREIERRYRELGKARKAIVESLGGPWKRGTPGSRGSIDCPVCGGKATLHFTRAGYNGHIHAHCGTKDCVCWME
jgi:hypothetical protein